MYRVLVSKTYFSLYFNFGCFECFPFKQCSLPQNSKSFKKHPSDKIVNGFFSLLRASKNVHSTFTEIVVRLVTNVNGRSFGVIRCGRI